MKCLEQRIADPNIKRLLARFLKAGIMENGEWEPSEEGTPKGGVSLHCWPTSYLHYILKWCVNNENKYQK
jgi:retron-type reverse transcriptase